MIEAAKIAGVDIKDVINDSKAIAIYYRYHHKEEDWSNKRVIIIDIGGMTTEMSIIEIDDYSFKTNCLTGSTTLGGITIDNELFEKGVEKLKSSYGIDIREEGKETEKSELWRECVKAKTELRKEKETYSFKICGNEISFSWSELKGILNSPIKEQIKNLLDGILKTFKEMFGKDMKDIDKIILTGGLSNIPFIRDYFSEITARDVTIIEDKSFAVAKGASLYGFLTMNNDKIESLDVTPYDIGIGIKSIDKNRNVKAIFKEI